MTDLIKQARYINNPGYVIAHPSEAITLFNALANALEKAQGEIERLKARCNNLYTQAEINYKLHTSLTQDYFAMTTRAEKAEKDLENYTTIYQDICGKHLKTHTILIKTLDDTQKQLKDAEAEAALQEGKE